MRLTWNTPGPKWQAVWWRWFVFTATSSSARPGNSVCAAEKSQEMESQQYGQWYQTTRGNHADSHPKDVGSEACVAMYRCCEPPEQLGLVKKDSRETRVNRWLKPRDSHAAKGGCYAASTKKSRAPGVCSGRLHAYLIRVRPGWSRPLKVLKLSISWNSEKSPCIEVNGDRDRVKVSF